MATKNKKGRLTFFNDVGDTVHEIKGQVWSAYNEPEPTLCFNFGTILGNHVEVTVPLDEAERLVNLARRELKNGNTRRTSGR